MWPFDAVLAKERDRLRGERDVLTARLADCNLIIRQQADLIRQLRAENGTLPDYQPRICFCPPDRQERWREGLIAGPDGVVNTDDDVLNPEPPSCA